MIAILGWACLIFMAALCVGGAIDCCVSLRRAWHRIAETPWMEP